MKNFAINSCLIKNIAIPLRREKTFISCKFLFNYFNIITMTKTELIAAVAERSGIAKKEAQEVVNNLFDILTENLVKEESTVILGFGTLAVQHKPERQGINPSNRQKITIPARKAVKFKASKALLEKL